MNIDEYNEKKGEIEKQINRIKEDAAYLRDYNSITKLERLRRNCEEEKFKLIVVGEFSRGKSMFVNAIIGENMLPSSKNPTTATLNVIENGTEKAAFFLNYIDGTKREVSCEEFREIVAPECRGSSKQEQAEFLKSIGEISKIHHIQINVRNELGKQGITIVDTPGVNDLDARREQITYDYIPNSDAAIVVCSAIPPLTASEFKFIHERILKNDISKVFVIINFKDLLHTEEECNAIKNLFCEKLRGIVPVSRIFLISSKQALTYKRKSKGEILKSEEFLPKNLEETGFPLLEKEMLSFLANERGSIRIERFKACLASICADMLYNVLPRRKQAVVMSKEEIERRILQLKPQIEHKRLQCRNTLDSMKRDILLREKEFVRDYKELLQALADKAKRTVENFYGDSPEALSEVISDSTAALEEKHQVELPKRIREAITEIVERALKRLGEDFLDVGIHMNLFDANCAIQTTAISEIQISQTDVLGYSERNYDTGAQFAMEFACGFAIGAMVASLGLLAIPFMYAGGKLLSSMMNSKGDEKFGVAENGRVTNESVKKVFRAEVEKKYVESINYKVEEFQKNYKQSVDQIVDAIQVECEGKLEQIILQMEDELKEKQMSSCSIEEELRRLTEIETHLSKGIGEGRSAI